MAERPQRSRRLRIPAILSNADTELMTRTTVSQNGPYMQVRRLDPDVLQTRKIRTGGDREDEGSSVADRLRWFIDPRAYPGTDLSQQATLDAYNESVQREQVQAAAIEPLLASSSQWQLLGPGNFAGRVNSIAVDRSNTQRIYVCTSSGGVWRTENGGASWVDISQTLGSSITENLSRRSTRLCHVKERMEPQTQVGTVAGRMAMVVYPMSY